MKYRSTGTVENYRREGIGEMSVLGTILMPLRRVGRCFFAGILVLLPFVITAAVVGWLVGRLGTMVGPGTLVGKGLRGLGFQFVADSVAAYALGWAVVLGAILLLGLFVQSRTTRFIQDRVDGFVQSLPLLGGLYGTAKQLTGMLDRRREADLEGMRVVYCRFGAAPGTLCLALLASPRPVMVEGHAYYSVLVPTAPVPVGGGLLFVPSEAVIPADMSIDTFMGVYVSMGATSGK